RMRSSSWGEVSSKRSRTSPVAGLRDVKLIAECRLSRSRQPGLPPGTPARFDRPPGRGSSQPDGLRGSSTSRAPPAVRKRALRRIADVQGPHACPAVVDGRRDGDETLARLLDQLAGVTHDAPAPGG